MYDYLSITVLTYYSSTSHDTSMAINQAFYTHLCNLIMNVYSALYIYIYTHTRANFSLRTLVTKQKTAQGTPR
jgi:hypothetical protein